MTYIDFYLVPVPREHKAAYEELARVSAPILKEHGALRVVECWLDESGPESASYHAQAARSDADEGSGFVGAAGAGANETVVLSFAEWPDRATRDIGMAKATSDPRMLFDDRPPVFEGKRLVAGGFNPMLDE